MAADAPVDSVERGSDGTPRTTARSGSHTYPGVDEVMKSKPPWMSSRSLAATLTLLVLAVGCEPTDRTIGPGGEEPAPPRNFEAFYYDHAVHLSWTLDPAWDEEPFRIYGKRVADPEFFLVAEVTNCVAGACSYTDVNLVPLVSYEYYVAAVHRTSGVETVSEHTVEVFVPEPTPPPPPGSLDAIPLDEAIFLRWDDRSRDADDFSLYRIYMGAGTGSVLYMGETDSEGFLDLLVQNGETYEYFVTAVDDQGHESEPSERVLGTPRPDYHGELLHAFGDRPDLSGFRFQDSELSNPILPGDSPDRDFRFEVDGDGWWLVPRSGVEVHRQAIFTTALRCGPAADSGCSEVRIAPASLYSDDRIALVPEHSYVVRVPSNGQWHYGVIRVTHLGEAQQGAVLLFDWAFQLQPGNRALIPAS